MAKTVTRLGLGLLAASCLLSPVQAAEKGKHARLQGVCPQAEQAMKERTVRVVTPLQEGLSAKGGALRLNNRYALTADHVVAMGGATYVEINGQKARVLHVTASPELDLAVLEHEELDEPELPMPTFAGPEEGGEAYAHSFEQQRTLTLHANGTNADSLVFQDEAVRGDSGVPAFNCKGEVLTTLQYIMEKDTPLGSPEGWETILTRPISSNGAKRGDINLFLNAAFQSIQAESGRN